VLTAPAPGALAMDSLERGRVVTLLGRFEGYALVRRRSGMQGWVTATALDDPAAAGGMR